MIASGSQLLINIGGTAIALSTSEPTLLNLLRDRYQGFIGEDEPAELEFEIQIFSARDTYDDEEELRVSCTDRQWFIQRGDFSATWNMDTGNGTIHTSVNPYSIDALLRIVHSLILARQGTFLLHSASVVRNGKAFLFCGVSGAGKTTMGRLAPPDVTLLTDEISYVRLEKNLYFACGTPFAGELAKIGENVSAPIDTVFLLTKGNENRIEQVTQSDAAHAILRNILFFAEDTELITGLFEHALNFVRQVSIKRLVFVPEVSVWSLIQ